MASANRVMDIQGETHIKNPIHGLKAIALTTLSIALATIVTAGIIDSGSIAAVEFLAYEAAGDLLRNGPDEYGLTRDEIGAIHAYTQESALYGILNLHLRNGDRDMLKPFFAFLKLLLTALYKLPKRDATVYRGVKLLLSALGGAYVVKKTVIWWGVSSTTTCIDTLSSAQFCGKSGARSLFTIILKSGVSIARYSAVPLESEIVSVPGTVFSVAGVLDLGHDLSMVQMEENTDAPALLDFTRADVGAGYSVPAPVAAVASQCEFEEGETVYLTEPFGLLSGTSGDPPVGYGCKGKIVEVYEDFEAVGMLWDGDGSELPAFKERLSRSPPDPIYAPGGYKVGEPVWAKQIILGKVSGGVSIAGEEGEGGEVSIPVGSKGILIGVHSFAVSSPSDKLNLRWESSNVPMAFSATKMGGNLSDWLSSTPP